MVHELNDPTAPDDEVLAAYALSIYARQVREVVTRQPIPEDQVRLTPPPEHRIRKSFPHHMAWVVLSDTAQNAERAGFFRALWMYPPNQGFVEWGVTSCRFDRKTIFGMLAAFDRGEREELYDRPVGAQEAHTG